MLIINQWATSGAEYITDDIKVKDEDIDGTDMSCLYVNGLCFAMLNNRKDMDELSYRLHRFVDKSKRTTDTFDISIEIENIQSKKIS